MSLLQELIGFMTAILCTSSRGLAVCPFYLIVWAAIVLSSVSATELNKTKSTLKGRVVGQEEKPIVGVEVNILELGLTTVTDDMGQFVFASLCAGKVTVEARAEGFFPSFPTEVELEEGREREMEIQLARKFVLEETLVVTGTRHEEYISQAPVRTELLEREICVKKANLNLAEALTATMPGVRVEASCQGCGSTQVRLNGLAGKYTQILEDGLPTFSGASMAYGLEQLPVEVFEQIEVVKGGTSALYGPNAVGGVINLIRRAPTRTQFRVGCSGGFHSGEPLGSGSIGGQISRPGFGLDFHFRAVGQSPVDRDGDGFTDAPKRETYAGGVTYYRPFLGENAHLTVGGTLAREIRRGGENKFSLPPEETALTGMAESKRYGGFFRWNHTFSSTAYYTFATNYTHLGRKTYYGAGFDPNAYGSTHNPLWSSDLSVGHQMGDHLITTGFQYQRERVDDRISAYHRDFNETFTNAGLYVQDQFRVSSLLTVVGGVRVDDANTLEHNVISPRGHLRLMFNENLQSRFGISTGFRAPVIFEEDLHVAAVGGEGLVIQNSPYLREESSLSFTAALDYVGLAQGLPYQFGASFFHTGLNGVHVLEEIDVPVGDYRQLLRVNSGGSYVRGVELSWDLQVHPRARLRGGATFQVSRYRQPEPQFGSTRYFRTPDRYGFVGVDVGLPGRFGILSTLDITGPMLIPHYAGYIQEDRLEESKTFVVWNAVIDQDLEINAGQMRLYLAIDNILDDHQEDLDQGPLRDSGYFYGPLYARRVRVGFSMRF